MLESLSYKEKDQLLLELFSKVDPAILNEVLKSFEKKKETYPELIMQQLIYKNVPANLKGYRYVSDVVLFVCENKKLRNHFTTEIYPLIAKRYDTSPSAVERAIRTVVHTAYRSGGVTRKMKPSEFIMYIVEEVRMEYSKL